MQQTKQQKLLELSTRITERTAYLRTIEIQIEDISIAANNRLFELHGEINEAEKELARAMRRSYELTQANRERERIALN